MSSQASENTQAQRPLRVVFMGSPDFAVPSLHAVAATCELVGVVSQPDRPAGRGRKLRAPAVKDAALELTAFDGPILQPSKVRDGTLAAALRDLAPDLIVVTAYGRILPTEILELAPHGCINVHASLLPKWRGAAPIQRAVLAGDPETGVAIMQMDEGCDTGPVFEMRATPIGPNETSGELFVRLAELGGEVLEDFLRRFPEVPAAEAQDHDAAMHAPKLEKSEGAVDFSLSAARVHDHIRGMDPWPGAFAQLGDDRVKLFASRVVEAAASAGEPGSVLGLVDGALRVACGEGVVALGELQAPGKRRMDATAFASGRDLAGAGFTAT